MYKFVGKTSTGKTKNLLLAAEKENGTVMISIDAIVAVMGSKIYKHPFGVIMISPDIEKTFKLTALEADNIIKKFY